MSTGVGNACFFLCHKAWVLCVFSQARSSGRTGRARAAHSWQDASSDLDEADEFETMDEEEEEEAEAMDVDEMEEEDVSAQFETEQRGMAAHLRVLQGACADVRNGHNQQRSSRHCCRHRGAGMRRR